MMELWHTLMQLLTHVPALFLWLGASIGHGFLWVVTINVSYAFDFPHRILDNIRRLDALFVLFGPVLFYYVLWIGNTDANLSHQLSVVHPWLTPYLVFCFLLGSIVAPVAQVRYWLRPRAPQVISRVAEVADLARELGQPPRGSGKEAALSHLPGNQVFQVEFVDLHLRLPQLPPAWEGLTLLHLTDLHFHHGLDRKFYHYVMDRCLEWGTPDLVCITGDIVDSPWHHRWIPPILGRLRWNVAGLFILGNHDCWFDINLTRRRMARLGFQNVGNTWESLEVRGRPLTVIGNEGPWLKPIPDLSKCSPPPLEKGGAFRLCLSHSPDPIGWAQRHQIDLMLAGHVHGGQIRFPLIGSVFVPSRYSRRYDCGTFFEKPTVLHVGRGLSGKHLLRYLCRPEVTRIVLHSEPRT